MKNRNSRTFPKIVVGIFFIALSIILTINFAVAEKSKKRVVYIHDGAIDEYVSYLLLSTMSNVDLKGVIIVNADCIDTPAMNAQWKFQQFTNQTNVPLALSRARGWNPFPWNFRAQCIQQNNVELLQEYDSSPASPSGEKLLQRLLQEAVATNSPVTLLINCPLTPLRLVLSQNPKLEEGIEELVWMGGAINVPGNLGHPPVVPKQVANDKAEWNVYWDPASTEWIFENTSFPIVEFPLDITNKAKITEKFLSGLKKQGENFTYSELAFQSYNLITSLTKANQSSYEMWDVLTTTYIARPDIFTRSSTLHLSVVTDGKFQGALRKKPDGRKVKVMFEFDKNEYYTYVLQQFKTSL